MLEKRGVIDENTPQHTFEPIHVEGEPTTKEAADAIQGCIVTDLVDAVAAQSRNPNPKGCCNCRCNRNIPS